MGVSKTLDGPCSRPDRFVWSPRELATRWAARDFRLSTCHHAPMCAPIPERLRAALADRYGQDQLMDVVFTVGQYHLVSMALKTFRVPLDDGVEGFPR